MSVANIIDPVSGVVKSEYLADGSLFAPNEVINWTQGITPTTAGPGLTTVIPGTSTTVSPGEVYMLTGAYYIGSSVAVGGEMAINIKLTGSSPDLIINLVNYKEVILRTDGPSETFSTTVFIPPGYNNLSITVGAGLAPNVGTITLYPTEFFINEVVA